MQQRNAKGKHSPVLRFTFLGKGNMQQRDAVEQHSPELRFPFPGRWGCSNAMQWAPWMQRSAPPSQVKGDCVQRGDADPFCSLLCRHDTQKT